MKLRFAPLTPECWPDFEGLFGERGACGGCWCMFWRLSRKQFEAGKGTKNQRAMKKLVETGAQPGILAFHGDKAVGWCALAPREDYPALTRSRVLAPVDDKPVWSVACFFVRKDYRGQGVATRLLKAARKHVREHGGRILEGYPVLPTKGPIAPAFAWTGIPSAFERAGFREVARRSPTRPIMRATLRPKR